MSSLTVLARLVVKEDKIEAAQSLLQSLIEPTRQEQGCIEYRLHQDNENPRKFFFYENWENKASLDAHLSSPHLKAFFEAEKDLFAEPIDLTLASES